jgi:chaperonin GroES
MKIKPLKDRILVERDEMGEKTESGIILSNNEDKHLPTGTVLAVGSEVKNVKTGEKVLFSKYAGIDIDEHFLLSEDEVLGVIEG